LSVVKTEKQIFVARTELIVLITPRVIRNQEEARAVTRELRKTLRNAADVLRSRTR
jgi:type II secretory pathway component GspD/PulD (secretin)